MTTAIEVTESRDMCECGHDSGDHQGLRGKCTANMCNCLQFHGVTISRSISKSCVECGREYQCSYSRNSTSGDNICNICMKNIENAYKTGVEKYLFGFRDDKVTQLKAMKMAMEIYDSGVDIKTLWEFYQSHKGGSCAK